MDWAVVMTGGKGTRFWPESRSNHPKPFLSCLNGRTPLEETVDRIQPLFPPHRILIVLQDTLVRKARKLFPAIPRENFLGEPMGRNTAPCCVFAASRIERRDPSAKLVFLPADQLIRPKSSYLKILKTAFDIVDDRPVLLGMRPDSPHPGYGYLEVNPKGKTIHGVRYFSVRRFLEKPGLAEARRFLKRGNFLWNGGTFVWRLDAFKEAVKKYFPRAFPAWKKWMALKSTRRSSRLTAIFRTLPTISIDYAVMEKMKNVHCLLMPLRWNDVGNWVSLAELWPSDAHQNRIQGPVLSVQSGRNIVKANNRLIALCGVHNMVIIDTRDALLVCPRSEIEGVREVVRELEKRKAYPFL